MPNSPRGPRRRFHPVCLLKRNKAQQAARRKDPAVRRERNRKERDRRAEVSKDPNLRELANAKKRNRDRRTRDQAKLFRDLDSRLRGIELRIDALENKALASDAEARQALRDLDREVSAIRRELPGGKATGL